VFHISNWGVGALFVGTKPTKAPLRRWDWFLIITNCFASFWSLKFRLQNTQNHLALCCYVESEFHAMTTITTLNCYGSWE